MVEQEEQKSLHPRQLPCLSASSTRLGLLSCGPEPFILLSASPRLAAAHTPTGHGLQSLYGRGGQS